jgi:hypothetical protein
MPQYLVAIHLPDDFDESRVDKAMERDIGALNEEMQAAGARIFAGGLLPASSAKSLRAQPDGKVLITDGRTWRPKNTSAGSGYWKPLTWRRRWRGGVRPSSPVGRRSRYARSAGTAQTQRDDALPVASERKPVSKH